MKSSIIVSFLLLLVSCRPNVDCIKIDMLYTEVVKSCGKPNKHSYRADHLDKIEYRGQSFEFTVGFNREEKVNFYRYKTPEMEKVEYTEVVE